MAKNRRNQSAAIRFGPALKVFLLCLLLGGSGVGYVWLKSQIYSLGQRIIQQEAELRKLQRGNEQLRGILGAMESPKALAAGVQKLNMGLAPVPPEQILHLREPSEGILAGPAVPAGPRGLGLAMR